jgi:chemotaxis protein MotB
MQFRTSLCLVLPLYLFTGCVSKGTYEKLQQDSAALGDRNKSQASEIGDQQSQIAALKAQIQNQNTLLDDLQARLGKVTKNKAELDRSLAQTKQALNELLERKAEMENQLREFRSVTEGLKGMIDTGSVKVRFIKGRMVVTLGSDVLFHSGSARLSGEGRAEIEAVTKQLAVVEGKDFQVEGHTDNIPIRTREFPSNWELAAARAVTVVDAMIAAGMPAERISAASFSDTRPAVPNDSPADRAQNRRIDIAIVPDLSKLMDVESLDRQASSPPGEKRATAPAPPPPSEDLGTGAGAPASPAPSGAGDSTPPSSGAAGG